MKSFTNYQTRLGDVLNNTAGSVTSWATEMLNDSIRYLVTKYYFNERSYTVPGGTVAQQQFYNLPPQVKKVINCTVTVGSVKWQPTETPTRQVWDRLNVITTYFQDYPSNFFIFNGQIGLFPIPASSGNPITINYKTRIPDLAQADVTDVTSGATVFVPYTATTTASPSKGSTTFVLSNGWPFTTGTYAVTFANAAQDVQQVSLTNGSTFGSWSTGISGTATSTQTFRLSSGADFVSVTGGTISAFNKWMANSGWIRIPSSTTDSANGDNQWYQISAFGTQVTYGTTVTLANQYGGTTVTAGKFTIGDMSILPEDYEDLPLYRTAAIYYTTRFPDPGKAQLYQKYWDDGILKLDEEFGSKTESVILPDVEQPLVNPNLFQRSVSGPN